MLMAICIWPEVVPRAWAAAGSAGTNMCIAIVPLIVISTSSHRAGAGARLRSVML